MRGAIVHGEVAWGQLTYGKAVIQAYKIEQSLDWIGIACSPKLPRVDEMWDWDTVVVYPVPKRQGQVQVVSVVSWQVPSAKELTSLIGRKGLMKDGDILNWEILTKVERTLQFGIYLRAGKASGSNPRLFQSISSMQFLGAF